MPSSVNSQAALLLLLATSVSTHLLTGCPHIEPKIHLDIPKFLGKWYGVELLYNYHSPKLSCVKFTHGLTEDHDLSIHMESITDEGEIYESEGEAVMIDPVFSSQMKFFWMGQVYTLNVIDTDYENYAVIFACGANPDGLISEFGVILSREKYIPEELVHKFKGVLVLDGIDVLRMYPVDHTHC